jgi:lysine-N-methylase
MTNSDQHPLEQYPTKEELAEAQPLIPSYASAFHCIGRECEDTCCRDWSIPLDKKTYQIYARFPSGKLGSIVAKSVSVTPDAPESLYARINLAPSGFCPFFAPDQLCGIQKEYGAQALSATCSIYPRTLNTVDGVLEGSLALSCPEAARNILLFPDSLQVAGELSSGALRTDNSAWLARNAPGAMHKPYGSFHSVRALLVDMVKDRSRPIWQRLLLIGSLCKRLDTIRSAEQDGLVSGILSDYRHIHEDASVQAELESMPTNPRKKLDVILSLSSERAENKNSGKRFSDTFWNFVEGIGSASAAQPEEDLLRFLTAEKNFHHPFFARRPFLLENYLLNDMFQNLFPFGREGSPHFTNQSIFDEYILMTTRFAWMNGLLVGVAGCYADAFNEEHVIRTVQSFCRAVDHFPYVLVSINEYIRRQKLDSLQGMAILLR